MNKWYFEIADLILLVEADTDIISEELMDFRCDRVDKPDVVVRFEVESAESCMSLENCGNPEDCGSSENCGGSKACGIPESCRGSEGCGTSEGFGSPDGYGASESCVERKAKVLVEDPMLVITETPDAYVVQYKNAQAVSCYVNEKERNFTRVYLTEQSEVGPEILYTIRDAFFFHMQKHGRIAVHSASILYKDKVWLFSARSGMGKSTHVSRWHDAGFDFEDFNGDLAICFWNGESVMAAGSPWCGTSKIFCNQKAPLGGVLFLERALEDCVGKIEVPEGMARLAARCLTPNWNRELMEANIDAAGMVVPRIVTGVLECTNRIEAARTAKQFIDAHCF